MKRVSLKGVAIGNIADIVSSNIIGLLLAAYILISSAPSGLAEGSANQVLMASSFYRVSVIILGALCSVLGGYVSARIAKHDDMLSLGNQTVYDSPHFSRLTFAFRTTASKDGNG